MRGASEGCEVQGQVREEQDIPHGNRKQPRAFVMALSGLTFSDNMRNYATSDGVKGNGFFVNNILLD